MEKKYDVQFCSCGRIHCIPYEMLDWLSEDYAKRSIIHVCLNCGASTEIGLTEYMDGFALCKNDIDNKVITCDNETQKKLIFDYGIEVPTDKGYATGYFGHQWSVEEDGPIELAKVNPKRLIREVNDEDKLRSISGYLADIDWTGTPYEL